MRGLGFTQRPTADGVPGYALNIYECDCTFKFGIDADFILKNVNTKEDRIQFKCPSCDALIIIGERL